MNAQPAITSLASRALPLMRPEHRAEAERLLAALQAENAADNLQAAGNAFEKDMQPVTDAIVAALQAEDLEALRGLRAMLPELLVEVLGNKALENHFAFLLGTAVVRGIRVEAR